MILRPASLLNSRCCLATDLCLTLCDPVDCSLPGASVHEIFQVKIREWAVISFSRGPSDPRIEPTSPVLADGFFTPRHQGSPYWIHRWILTLYCSLFLDIQCIIICHLQAMTVLLLPFRCGFFSLLLQWRGLPNLRYINRWEGHIHDPVVQHPRENPFSFSPEYDGNCGLVSGFFSFSCDRK